MWTSKRFFSTEAKPNVVKIGIPKASLYEGVNSKIGRNQRIALLVFSAGLAAALYTIVTEPDPLSVWAFPAPPTEVPTSGPIPLPPSKNK